MIEEKQKKRKEKKKKDNRFSNLRRLFLLSVCPLFFFLFVEFFHESRASERSGNSIEGKIVDFLSFFFFLHSLENDRW